MTSHSRLSMIMSERRLAPTITALAFCVFLILTVPGRTSDIHKEMTMKTAKGEFEVSLAPQDDGDFSAGRMTLDKTYHGDLEASSKGQMLSHRSAVDGSAGYVALETVTGTLAGHKGTFVLLHRGVMQGEEHELLITVSPDSGTGELKDLKGQLTIRMEDGKHYYDFDYEL